MLSLRRSNHCLTTLHRLAGSTRFLTGGKKNEIVISEVKHLATVAIKLYNAHDLDSQMKFLRDLRVADPSNRQTMVAGFGRRYPRIASTWLSQWIAKSVATDSSKMFPVIVPIDDAQLSLGVKSDLANAIYTMKTSNAKSGVGTSAAELKAQAMRLADELGNSIHIDRLRIVGSAFQDFVDGQVTTASFLDELATESGPFAHELLPLLEFTELPLPEQVQQQLQSSEQDRQFLHTSLVNELTYITHVANSSRFNAADKVSADSGLHKSAKELLKELPPPPEGKADRSEEKEHLRRSVIIGNAADFADYEPSSQMEATSTGVVLTRRAIDPRRKLRFSADLFLFNVKAPCYRVGQSPQGVAREYAASSSLNYDHGLLQNSMEAALADPGDLPETNGAAPAATSESIDSPEAMPNRKIMIDNLPRNITEEELRHALRKCGKIAKVWIYLDERATPEEVKYMNALRMRSLRAKGTYIDLKNTEGPFNLKLDGTMLLPEVKQPGAGAETGAGAGAGAAATEADADNENDDPELPEAMDSQEGPSVDAYEKTVKGLTPKKLPNKQKLLRGSLKTDNYAFVQMADDESYDQIAKPAVRLFGITIGGRACRVYPSHIYKSFMLEIGQELDVRGVVDFVNTLLKGRFECYVTPTYENCRPVFLHLQFDNATDAWIAHDMLMRALDELNRSSLVITRKVLWRARIVQGSRKPISINLSWIKSQWYKEWFFRASKYLERKEDEAAESQENSQERSDGPQWHNLSNIDLDAVDEELDGTQRSKNQPGASSEGGNVQGNVSGAASVKLPKKNGRPRIHPVVEPPLEKRKIGRPRKPVLIAEAKTGSTDGAAGTPVDAEACTATVVEKKLASDV